MLRRTILLLLLVPTMGLAQEDTTVFGRKDDRYGPKEDAVTFSLFGGGYWRGVNQELITSSEKTHKIWNYGLRLGWAFNENFELEANLSHTQTKTLTSPQNVYTYDLNGVLQTTFQDRVTPYLTLGAGGLRLEPEVTGTKTHFAINYGAGIKLFIFRNLAIRPDFRALTSFDYTHTAFLGTLNLTYYAATKSPAPAPTPTPQPTATPEPPPPVIEATPTPAPIGDRDGDGILDDKDKCPDQPETKNGYKDDDGCPDHEIDEFSGIIVGIEFETRSTIIEKHSYPILNKAADVLKKYPELRIQIEGHTDSTGPEKFNQYLSRKRGESVREYLMHKGVAGSRLDVKGYGPSKPLASNKTKEGRRQNRRIEFVILNREVLEKK